MLGSYARVFDGDDVLKLLHSRVKSAGGQSAFARETGVERTYLNRVLIGKKPPGGPSILDALNLRIVYSLVARRAPNVKAGRAIDD
jgi:DNA-binding phage protein